MLLRQTARHRHVYGPISLHLTPINCYKLPIIAYLLQQELSGRVCKIIWKLNSELLSLSSAHEGRNLLFISSLSLAPAFICTSSLICSDAKIMVKNLGSGSSRFGIFRFVPIPNGKFTHFFIFYLVRTFGSVRSSVFFGRFRNFKFSF